MIHGMSDARRLIMPRSSLSPRCSRRCHSSRRTRRRRTTSRRTTSSARCTIPMRDGVKLFTIIYSPQDDDRALSDADDAHGVRHRPVRTGQLPRRARTEQRVRERGLHLRLPGHAREVQVRGRVHSPRADRQGIVEAERKHRHLGHDRLAGEERAEQQRARRPVGHLVGGLGSVAGDDRRAPGAEGVVAAGAAAGSVLRRRLSLRRRVSDDVRLQLDVDQRAGARRAVRARHASGSTTARRTAIASSSRWAPPPTRSSTLRTMCRPTPITWRTARTTSTGRRATCPRIWSTSITRC